MFPFAYNQTSQENTLKENNNPRIIADPFVAAFCKDYLSDFNSVVFRVKGVRREENNGAKECGEKILNMCAFSIDTIDLVVGGLPELEIKAKRYLIQQWGLVSEFRCNQIDDGARIR